MVMIMAKAISSGRITPASSSPCVAACTTERVQTLLDGQGITGSMMPSR